MRKRYTDAYLTQTCIRLGKDHPEGEIISSLQRDRYLLTTQLKEVRARLRIAEGRIDTIGDIVNGNRDYER